MRQLIEVRKVASGTFRGAFEVVVQFRPLMEDMFETVCYGDVFENIIDANRLVERLKAKAKTVACYQTIFDALDLTYWTWMPSPCSPCLQAAPTHVRKKLPASQYAINLVNRSD